MGGNIETVKYCLDKGININARDFRDHTPLHWAVSNNKEETESSFWRFLDDRGNQVAGRGERAFFA